MTLVRPPQRPAIRSGSHGRRLVRSLRRRGVTCANPTSPDRPISNRDACRGQPSRRSTRAWLPCEDGDRAISPLLRRKAKRPDTLRPDRAWRENADRQTSRRRITSSARPWPGRRGPSVGRDRPPTNWNRARWTRPGGHHRRHDRTDPASAAGKDRAATPRPQREDELARPGRGGDLATTETVIEQLPSGVQGRHAARGVHPADDRISQRRRPNLRSRRAELNMRWSIQDPHDHPAGLGDAVARTADADREPPWNYSGNQQAASR